jgi:hypothetical protein
LLKNGRDNRRQTGHSGGSEGDIDVFRGQYFSPANIMNTAKNALPEVE